MFYFRINKVCIDKKRELIGKAEVMLLSFVSVEETDFPRVDDLLTITDENQRKALLEKAINKVTGSVQIPEVDKVRKGQEIPFGDTGLTLFKSTEIPNDFNWLLLAIESDSKIRRQALATKSFFTKEKTDNIISRILGLLTLSTPGAAAVTSLTPIVFLGICNALKNNKDDQMGMLATSFVRQLHYPNGNRKSGNVKDSTGNLLVDYEMVVVE